MTVSPLPLPGLRSRFPGASSRVVRVDKQAPALGEKPSTSCVLPITGGAVLLSPACHAWAAQWNWYVDEHGYAARHERIFGRNRKVFLHRALISAPEWIQVDHANGVRLDNRRENLRFTNCEGNSRNASRAPNRTGYRGVKLDSQSGRFKAYIQTGEKKKYLGSFMTAEEAGAAYTAAALKVHGDFAFAKRAMSQ